MRPPLPGVSRSSRIKLGQLSSKASVAAERMIAIRSG